MENGVDLDLHIFSLKKPADLMYTVLQRGFLFVLLVLMLYIPVNNFSVMLRQFPVFLG